MKVKCISLDLVKNDPYFGNVKKRSFGYIKKNKIYIIKDTIIYKEKLYYILDLNHLDTDIWYPSENFISLQEIRIKKLNIIINS